MSFQHDDLLQYIGESLFLGTAAVQKANIAIEVTGYMHVDLALLISHDDLTEWVENKKKLGAAKLLENYQEKLNGEKPKNKDFMNIAEDILKKIEKEEKQCTSTRTQ